MLGSILAATQEAHALALYLIHLIAVLFLHLVLCLCTTVRNFLTEYSISLTCYNNLVRLYVVIIILR